MKVEVLPPEGHDEWDRFVESTPGGSLFLTSWWHRVWNAEAEVRVARDGSGKICAGMAFCPSRILGHRAVARPPLTPYNHPLLDETSLPRVSQQVEALKALVGGLARYRIVDFVFRHGARLGEPFFVQSGFQSSLSLTYVIDRDRRTDWKDRLSKSHRYSLRKAGEQLSREGWRVSKNASDGEAWSLFQTTGERRSFPLRISRENFARSLRSLTERGAGELWSLVDASGRMLCSSLLVRDWEFAYYLANGTHPEQASSFLGNYLLLESMIQDTLDRGLGFDFEGSVLPGVEPFFRGWGGDLHYNVRQTKLSSALLHVLWWMSRYVKSRKRHG